MRLGTWSFGDSWLLVTAAVAIFTAGCGSRSSGSADDAKGAASGTKRIILLTNGADPFWDAMRAGMQDAEKDFKLADAKLHTVMDVNDGTPKGQVDRLRQYANQSDIAAVAVSVTDAKNLAIAKAMEECQQAGIKVIAIDSDVDRKTNRHSRFAYLGTDNVLGGQELGKAAAGIRPAGRQVRHVRRAQRRGQCHRAHRRFCRRGRRQVHAGSRTWATTWISARP